MRPATIVAAGSSVAPSRIHHRDLIGVGLIGLRSRRLRTVLTAAGIAIGIAAMVAVLGVPESSRAGLLATLDRLGTNMLRVTPGQSLGGSDAKLPAESRGMISRVGPVQSVAAVAFLDGNVRKTDLIPEAETGGINVMAADTNLLATVGANLRHGTFLNRATERYPATVLGTTAARRLGIDRLDQPVNVWLSGHWFTVVGILDPVDLAPELDSAALIGFPVAKDLFHYDGAPGTTYVRAVPEQVENVRRVLPATTNPEHPEEIRVSRPSDALAARAATAGAFTSLLLGLGAVALVVGGVGIANVMLMSVLERRSEIGLRRALGATRRHIAIQFLMESLLLSGFGGALGVGLGAAISSGYALSQAWTIVVPPIALIGGVVAALGIGAFAGGYPAIRAARIQPTDALRTT